MMREHDVEVVAVSKRARKSYRKVDDIGLWRDISPLRQSSSHDESAVVLMVVTTGPKIEIGIGIGIRSSTATAFCQPLGSTRPPTARRSRAGRRAIAIARGGSRLFPGTRQRVPSATGT